MITSQNLYTFGVACLHCGSIDRFCQVHGYPQGGGGAQASCIDCKTTYSYEKWKILAMVREIEKEHQ